MPGTNFSGQDQNFQEKLFHGPKISLKILVHGTNSQDRNSSERPDKDINVGKLNFIKLPSKYTRTIAQYIPCKHSQLIFTFLVDYSTAMLLIL